MTGVQNGVVGTFEEGTSRGECKRETVNCNQSALYTHENRMMQPIKTFLKGW
jgi:hypothetical protein